MTGAPIRTERPQAATGTSLAGWLMLCSIGLSFFVIAEPAPTDLAFILCVGAILLGMQVNLPQAIHTYAILAFGFLLTNSVSGLACTHMTFCFTYLGITAYLLMIPVVMTHLVVANGPGYLRQMYQAFFLAIIVSAALGFLARAGVLPGPATLYFREEEGLRLSPLFKDPNVYGPFLGAGLMVLLGHVVAHARRLWLGMLLILFVWLPMLMAFSRAAWLALAASLLVFVVLMLVLGSGLKARQRVIALMISGVFVILPVTALILAASGLLDFFGHRLGLQNYDSQRFESQAKAVAVAMKNPLGIGPGHYVGKTHFPESRFDLAPHNIYAKIWVENGFLGLALFVSFFVWAIHDLWRIATLRTDRMSIHVALIACLFGIAVNGYFIDTLHWRHLFVILGFAFCEAYIVDRCFPFARTALGTRRRLFRQTT